MGQVDTYRKDGVFDHAHVDFEHTLKSVQQRLPEGVGEHLDKLKIAGLVEVLNRLNGLAVVHRLRYIICCDLGQLHTQVYFKRLRANLLFYQHPVTAPKL